MRIDRNSYGTLALVYLISIAVLGILLVLKCSPWVLWPVILVILVFCVWQTYFFRVPQRTAAGDSKKVTSAADGEVVIIEKVFESEYLKRDCIQISVYMDFFDVHANFWPVTGKITYFNYHPGKHLLAFKPKASEDNEHTCTGILTPEGNELFFKQIAGTFARRIVCYASHCDEAVAGQQCGIIKFGSRLDVFLPLDAEIKVSLHEKVRAAETVLAILR